MVFMSVQNLKKTINNKVCVARNVLVLDPVSVVLVGNSVNGTLSLIFSFIHNNE